MRKLLILTMLLSVGMASAQVSRDSVKIYFHQGSHRLDSTFRSNAQTLEQIERLVQNLEKVEVVGSASPEGSVLLNKRLSERRANALFDYLSRYGNLLDSLKTTRFLGRDWQGLVRLVEADAQVPYRQETLELLRAIVHEVETGVSPKTDPLRRLQALRGGKPYRYMYQHLFPELRASQVHLWFRPRLKPVVLPPVSFRMDKPDWQISVKPTLVLNPPEEKKHFLWALKTNALYDLLLVPNVGAEFYLGKNWSVGANWAYAWWKHDHKHWYWRVYGGDVYVRRWFGRKAEQKPLAGHHIGLYAQALTYDFATGGRGYMGGEPGGNIWDKATFAGGIEYGYSHPLKKRLNIDFTIGLGYLQGKYYEYIPQGECYVWQATKTRKWIGPTKAEVSLVWMLGSGDDKQKGGSR